MDKDLEGFINTRQAAKLTSYTKDYVGQLARAGHIESVKRGRERLVKVSDLFSYVSELNTNKDEPTNERETSIGFKSSDVNTITQSDSSTDTSESLSHDIATIDQSGIDDTTTVEKKVISPWVADKTSLANAHQQSYEVSNTVSKINSSSTVSNKAPQFSTKPYGKNDVKSSNEQIQDKSDNVLSMIATGVLSLSLIIFIFSITLTMNKLSANKNSNLTAQAAELDVLDEVSVGWYLLVSELF